MAIRSHASEPNDRPRSNGPKPKFPAFRRLRNMAPRKRSDDDTVAQAEVCAPSGRRQLIRGSLRRNPTRWKLSTFAFASLGSLAIGLSGWTKDYEAARNLLGKAPAAGSVLMELGTLSLVGLIIVAMPAVFGWRINLSGRPRARSSLTESTDHESEVQRLTEVIRDLRLRDKSSQMTAKKMELFLATLGHELRGPLNPLLLATEQLSEDRTSKERICQLAGIASRQVKQLERLIDDLCDLNRVHHGHLSIRVAPIDLADVINLAIEAVEPTIGVKLQRLAKKIEPGVFPVSGDSARLVQVFFNLLTNASRYSRQGASIGVEARRVGGQAIVSVSDSGIGISKENLENIFDLFKQVEPLSESSKDGFGVGLALVQQLVHLHGGRIEAVSEGLEKGSTFRILLPLTMVADDSTVQASLKKRRLTASEGACARMQAEATILRSVVVDDDADSADTLALALEAIGVNVRLAYDGAAGLSAVREFEPHVVFLDLSLPVMSGLEVARTIRGADWGKNVQLVALTGTSSAGSRQACVDSGFDIQLIKPLELSDLKQIFEPALA
jgi:signal transduction histidine kinase/CheY-like chemotaxis protein